MKSLLLALFVFLVVASPVVAQKGGVAVLDLDEVARQLGVEEKVRVDLLSMQNNLNADLKRTQETMQKQMAGVEQAAGEAPTEEQKKEIVATNQQLNEEFNRLKNQAQSTLAQERVRLINEFRVRLEPIALQAAKSAGLDVVLMKVTPPVFAYDTNVDITEASIKLALEAGMQVKTSGVTNAPEPSNPAAIPAAIPVSTGDVKSGRNETGKAKSTGE